MANEGKLFQEGSRLGVDDLYPPDDAPLDERARLSLCEALDRVLHKGVVVRGDIVISVADVDLVYIGLQLVLCSTDTALRAGILRPDARAESPASREPGEVAR